MTRLCTKTKSSKFVYWKSSSILFPNFCEYCISQVLVCDWQSLCVHVTLHQFFENIFSLFHNRESLDCPWEFLGRNIILYCSPKHGVCLVSLGNQSLDHRLSCSTYTQVLYGIHSEQNLHLTDATTNPKTSFCRVNWLCVLCDHTSSYVLFNYCHQPLTHSHDRHFAEWGIKWWIW